ncbi:MAG: membrane-associated protein [Acidobacteria bacterium]|nr:MAG: membrane-associated protein [Acidobacteriota bacterium]
MSAEATAQIPLWIKLAYTGFVCLLVPVYLRYYSMGNFLWFSDVALLAMVPALWLESRLIASMMALAVALPELAWNVDFFARLVTGRRLIGLADYMFDARKPAFLRALSLFHVVLPVLVIFTVRRLGYDPRALSGQVALVEVLVLLSYRLTDPSENVNWVFGPGARPQRRIPAPAYLACVMVFFPVIVYWPTHLLLERVLLGR